MNCFGKVGQAGTPMKGVLDVEARAKYYAQIHPWGNCISRRGVRYEIVWDDVKFTPVNEPKRTFKQKTDPITTIRFGSTVRFRNRDQPCNQKHRHKISQEITASRIVEFKTTVRLSGDVQAAHSQLPLQVPDDMAHVGVRTIPIGYEGGYQELKVNNAMELHTELCVPLGETHEVQTKILEQTSEYEFKQDTHISGRLRLNYYRGDRYITTRGVPVAELFRSTGEFEDGASFKLKEDSVRVFLTGKVTFQTNCLVDVETVKANKTGRTYLTRVPSATDSLETLETWAE